MRRVGGENNLDAALVKLRRQAVDRVIALVLFRHLVDRSDNDRHLETGHVVQDGLRVGDVIQNELELEFVGKTDRSFKITRALGCQHDGLLAVQIGQQSFQLEIALRSQRFRLLTLDRLRFLALIVDQLCLVVFGIDEGLAQLSRQAHAG